MGLLLFPSVFFTKRVIINGVLREKMEKGKVEMCRKGNMWISFLAHQKMLKLC